MLLLDASQIPAGVPSKRNALDFKGKNGRKIFRRFQHLLASSGRILRLQLTIDHSDPVTEIPVSNM
jgi:hypothetical protein